MQGLKWRMRWHEQTEDATESDVVGVKLLGVNK